MSLTEHLTRELAGILPLSTSQLEALERHYQLLLRWNQKLNLTTITELPAAATRHYGESLFLAAQLTPGSVIDIGSGAGFPGIPLAIARADCKIDLVEAHQRKAVFLREASRELANVKVIAKRAETLPPGKYDWMVSRAVDPAELLKLRLARRYALLLGHESAELLNAQVTVLPWGSNRVLAVSRGTD